MRLKTGLWICSTALVLGIAGWQFSGWTIEARQRAEAARACLLQAQRGDPKAEYELSGRYLSGAGVPQDNAEAIRWAQKAADQGFTAADTAIGSWYFHGRGVSQDYTQAIRWYSIAAAKGDAAGEYGLGYMYRHGMGVRHDDVQATQWIRKSAEQGYARAECELGYLYRQGEGLPQDYAQAANWYRKAALQGDAEAESGIAYLELYGYGVAENRREANEWFHKAAQQGDPYARHALGIVWLGMTNLELLLFVVQVSGGMFLILGGLFGGRGRARFRSKQSPLAGCLCLVSAAMWWYGYNHYALRWPSAGLNLFTSGKFLLDAVLIGLLVAVVRGETPKSELSSR